MGKDIKFLKTNVKPRESICSSTFNKKRQISYLEKGAEKREPVCRRIANGKINIKMLRLTKRKCT